MASDMRYTVVPWRDDVGQMHAWALWDRKLSPGLKDAGLPAYCGIEGKELKFVSFTKAWQWLSLCADRGLDLETGPGVTIRIHHMSASGGTLQIQKEQHYTGGTPLHPGGW